MTIPDFRDYRGTGMDYLAHSAKGSTWEKHKYIKIINGLYFYPDEYVGGRHIGNAKKTVAKQKSKTDKDSSKSSSGKDSDKKDSKKSDSKLDKYANAVISGKYGNGDERKKKLGKKYDKIQNRVNQILLGEKSAAKIAKREGFKLSSKAKKAISKASKKKVSSSKKKK